MYTMPNQKRTLNNQTRQDQHHKEQH